MIIPHVNSEIIPEASAISLKRYERYPKQKTIIISDTVFLEKSRNVFRIYDESRPNTNPMSKELSVKPKNSEMILIGVVTVISEVVAVYFITVLNKIIETASFVIPSPNTILKSFGCLS
jgi:hypothetical protein